MGCSGQVPQQAITHSGHWKFYLILFSSYYLITLFRFFSYMYIFKEEFCSSRFPYGFSNGL